MAIEFVDIGWSRGAARIEVDRIEPAAADAPLIVFLHEGLGSVAMWKDFPARLCAEAGAGGIVFSRPGYGWSTPRARGERWDPDFMHRQADEVLPALLRALGIDAVDRPPWLFGHSDGGSIALLAAAHRPDGVAGVIAVAPHIVVEPVSIASIEATRTSYETTAMRDRLARYHDDPDSAFYGWNDIWLDPRFRGWTIAHEIAAIRCPLLAVQGLDDRYGTIEQIRGIARRVPQALLLELPGCGHSPHVDRPDALIDAVVDFIAAARGGGRA